MPSRRISRRQVLFGSGLGLATLGLGACTSWPLRPAASSGSTTESLPSGNASTTAPVAIKKGSVLIVGQTSGVPSTSPYGTSPVQNTFRWGMFNPLVSLDASAQPVPHLAESWVFSDDRRILTLKLRQGVKFHSGRPFTAEDAKWNIEAGQDPKNLLAVAGELRGVEPRVVDAFTLELRLPDTMPHIFSLLVGVMMVDPQSDVMQAAAGTGAFRLESLEPGNEMRLVRNTTYWRRDRPYVDGVIIKALPDTPAAVVALEAGAAHVVWCQASDVQRLKSGSATTATLLSGSGSYEVLVSAVDPPFDDKRVRQGVGLALDRQRLALCTV
jgi:peptide/nickel transport system substrate-binding protein